MSGRYLTLSEIPKIESEVEIDDLSFGVRLSGNLSENDLTGIKKAIESEVSQGNRALRAVKEIQLSNSPVGSTITVNLHAFKPPKLALVRGEHVVACHLYTEPKEGQAHESQTKFTL